MNELDNIAGVHDVKEDQWYLYIWPFDDPVPALERIRYDAKVRGRFPIEVAEKVCIEIIDRYILREHMENL